MNKVLICLFILAALISISCNTTPPETPPPARVEDTPPPAPRQEPAATPAPETPPVIQGEPTQQAINAAYGLLYLTYSSKLDFTGAREYDVVKGDTLSEITRTYYNPLTNVGEAGTRNGFYFPVLMLATAPESDDIVDPDLIEIDMKIMVPDLRRNLDNPTARQAIKEFLLKVAEIYRAKGHYDTEEGLIRLSNSL